MADTFTAALKARKIEQGAYNNSYADRFNEDMVDVFDAAIAGVLEIDIGSSTTHALEAMQNGTLSDSHYFHLRFVGTPASAVTVTVPTSVTPSKEYLVENQTGQALTFKYAATAGVTVQDGDTLAVRCDGTNVAEAVFGPRHKITPAEIAAGVTPVDYAYQPGDIRRYGGGVLASASDNTNALQSALDSNQTVYVPDEGVHALNGAITFNDSNRIVGGGRGTVLRWNVTGMSLIRGANATTTRQFYFGMRDLKIDGTSRNNAGVIGLDLENLSIGTFENVEVQNCETGLRLDAGIGAFYNVFQECSFLTCDTAAIISTLANENVFIACRFSDSDAGVVIDDNSSNGFVCCSFEGITNIAIDIGNTAASLYNYFSKPRVEDAATGFRLDNADARSTTIIGPHFQTISGSTFSGTGLDTLILSGEINSPELRANLLALGQGNLDNAQWAYIKATANADVSVRNATDSGFADLRASDLHAARFLRLAGPAFGAAATVTLGNATQSTVGAAGGASALPATPSGYLRFFVGTTEFVIPYFAQA